MTSPQILEQNLEQKTQPDPVEALRRLIADLQALTDRLGLKEQSPSLQQTLKAAQERISGPRTVVMLLGEDAELKRRFLERLLEQRLIEPELAPIPQPAAAAIRLEYGAEPESTIRMPQGLAAVLPLNQLRNFLERHPGHTAETIRLPNEALRSGLAVIDTPALADEAIAARLLPEAEAADAWVLVLCAGQELSVSSRWLLRRLPEQAARLEILVEGAEALDGEARLDARERLLKTLCEDCRITEPRVTMVASATTEGDGGSFWHGRFATFRSVMMLRGRERWLDATRMVVLEAISEVGREMDFELKGAGLGLRQARLRLGLKDLEGLRARFFALTWLDSERPRELTPVEPRPSPSSPAIAGAPPASELAVAALAAASPALPATGSATTDPASLPTEGAPIMVAASHMAAQTMAAPPGRDNATAPGIPLSGDGASMPLPEATFVSYRTPDAPATPAKRGLSVRLSQNLLAMLRNPATEEGRKITPAGRAAGLAVLAAFLAVIMWALWPRAGWTDHEPAAQWSYPAGSASKTEQPASAGGSSASEAAAPKGSDANPVSSPPPTSADAGAGTATAESPNYGADSAATGTPGSSPAARTALPHPGTASGQTHHARRRRRNVFGRFWHWVRRDHSNSQE